MCITGKLYAFDMCVAMPSVFGIRSGCRMVKAFMPGSMAAANKINNYESLVGTEMEVMVGSYSIVIVKS